MAESSRAAPAAPEPMPVGGPSAPAKTGSTVIVACRIPHGLHLRTFDIVEVEEPSQTGFRKFKQAEPRSGSDANFTVRGPGRVLLAGLNADQIATLQPGGFALTHGCPTELWNSWLNDNRRAPYVLRGDIFAEPTMERVRNRANEYANNPIEALTGLEPIDPANPARRVRGEATSTGQRMMIAPAERA